MSPELIGLTAIIALFILLFSGIHIALAFLLVSLIGSIALVGVDITLSMWQIIPPMLLANFSFAVLPFFILMGLLSAHSGLANSAQSQSGAGLRSALGWRVTAGRGRKRCGTSRLTSAAGVAI